MDICRRMFAVTLAVLLVAAPQVALAGDAEQGRADAKRDARTDVSTWLWLGAGFCLTGLTTYTGAYAGCVMNSWAPPLVGCLFGLLAVGAAYVIVPSPPVARLMGKSGDYTLAYADAYTAERRNLQVQNAALGWGCGGTAFAAACAVILILWAASWDM